MTDVSPNDIKQMVRDLVDDAIENSPRGAHRWDIVRRLRVEHPEVNDFAAPLDTYLLGVIDRAMKPKRSETAQFPGMGSPVGITVTIPDGEGHYSVKALQFATEDDLLADEAIHVQNVKGAREALALARRRNSRLIPVMQEHGLPTAGDALKKLVELGEED